MRKNRVFRECFLYRRLITLIQHVSALCDTSLKSNSSSSETSSSDESYSECENFEKEMRSSETNSRLSASV